jgi:hypothetical protein
MPNFETCTHADDFLDAIMAVTEDTRKSLERFSELTNVGKMAAIAHPGNGVLSLRSPVSQATHRIYAEAKPSIAEGRKVQGSRFKV